MNLEIIQSDSKTVMDLPPGTATVGGAPADGVRIVGLSPRLVTLSAEPGRLVIEARRPVTVDRLRLPAGRRRLLLPGETVHLAPHICLRLPVPEADAAPANQGAATAALARNLLQEAREAPGGAGVLTCLTGLDLGRTFPLADGVTCLGRGDQADLRIRDRHASRRHARLSRQERAIFVEDLGSPNGVLVNGQRIRGTHPLADGDVLELGTTLLRFRAPTLEPAAEPAPASPPAAQAEAAPMARPDARPPGHRSKPRPDLALILAGLLLAFLGAALTVAVSRGRAPGPHGRPAAPSAGDAARRSW
jgi:hypothetical protein